MRHKILISTFSLILMLGYNAYADTTLKYLFKLGITIDEFKADSRYKNCLLKGHRFFASDFEDKKTKDKYVCQNISGAKEITLMFFNQKLIALDVEFIPPTSEEFFSFILDPNSKVYSDKYLATYNSLINTCQAIGKSQGKKLLDKGKKYPNGVFVINIGHQFVSSQGNNCMASYQAREIWNEERKKNDQWFFPQYISISNLDEAKKATNK